MEKRKAIFLALTLSCALTGCKSPPAPTVTVSGLWPERPALRLNPTVFQAGGDGFVSPRVESTRPLLVWESFPRSTDLASGTNGVFTKIKSVTYDVRIWGSGPQDDFATELVYARDALPAPSHRVETPLPSGAKCLWTVRARFELNGQTRVTEWSFIQSPAPAGGPATVEAGVRYPDLRYFRFSVP